MLRACGQSLEKRRRPGVWRVSGRVGFGFVRGNAFSSIRSWTAAFPLPISLTFGLPRIRKGAKGPLHYRDNERRRPAKRDPLICEDLPWCAEGFGQAFGKGSGSARPKSDRPRVRSRTRPGNSGEREPGFTPPRVETHPFSKSQPKRCQNPLAHPAHPRKPGCRPGSRRQRARAAPSGSATPCSPGWGSSCRSPSSGRTTRTT